MHSKFAIPAAAPMFIIHALIMFILQLAYGDVVAKDRVVAMTIRLTPWFMILTRMFQQTRKSILERG